MAKSGTTNSSNSTYNVLSNNEKLEGVRKQLIDGIKIDLLDTLKMDDMMVDRNELANAINDNRRDNFVWHPIIDKLKLNNSHPVVKEDNYKDILDEYDSLIAEKEANNWPDDHAEFNKKLRELDTRLAERITLDNWLAIQFKSSERFEDWKNAEEESKIAYENLNKMELNGIKKYEWKIDWISEEKGETNYFIIKRKPEELALIKAALKAIDEVSAMKDEDIETLKAENKKNSDTITDLTQRIEELEKNKKIEDEKKQEEIAELKKKYEALEQGNQTEWTDTDWKNGESTTKKGTSTGTNNSPTNSEKTPAETTEQTLNEATKQPEKGYLTEEQIDKILDDKLKKYLAPLLEAQEKTTRKASENKELNSKSRERSRESVETNPLYVSRKDVERSVLASRKNSDFPIWNVEIKWTYVNVEEFEFYEEIKQEYILARWDVVKLAELDKKLAELIILSSPKGVDIEHRYQIQLTEEEILAWWLVVSKDFLARYGLDVYYFDYTNTIIEREYQERLETIREIETEITELTTIITELTRKITIEQCSNESIILEIRQKKEKLRILKEKLVVLLGSLRSTWNKWVDKDLGILKDMEWQLQKELDDLKQKKKHQDDVNARIKEIEEELKNNETNNNEEKIQSKQKELDGLLWRIAELENKKRKKESRFNSDKVTDIEKITLKEDIEKLDTKIQKYKKDAEKLQSEIDNLQNWLNGKISEKIRKQLEDALDAMSDEQSLTIIAHDGKRSILTKKWDYFHKNNDYIGLFPGRQPNKEELLAALDTDKIQKIIIWESSQNPQEILLSDEKKLKDELEKLKAEQAWFDKDIDQEIANKEKELADVRNQIKNKETKRVVLAEFDDGDDWAHFHDYCGKNWIKRKDGKDIPLTWGLDTSAIYIDKDWRELKLEPTELSNGDWYDKPVAHYELVYYEQTENKWTDDIERQLLIIIHEQEILEKELEELEIKLAREKSESIKITIKEEIESIQKRLLIIKQNITEITKSTKLYRESIRQYRYRVYRVRPIPNPDWQESFEMSAVISDMWTDVFREKASLKVEEDLKAYYKSLWRWQVGSRLALFLGRWRRRKRMIRNEMNGMANTAFQRDAGYATLNDQSQNAADRHKHELDNNMEAINQIATVHNPQVDQLCKDYLNNIVTDDQFQDQFNQIIANDANIQNILNWQNITHIWTNILLRLQEQKALNQLILNMDAQLTHYIATWNQVYMDNMRNFVSQFIKDYQKTPAFMANFEQFVNWDLNARNRLKLYLNHQKQVMQMQITNLRMNIDILNKWKSAYQIDNKDRETWKWSWKFRLWHFMDKHPRWTAIASTAISVWIWLWTGLIASPIVAGWASLWLFGWLVWTTNAVKKWTHHTKEQNTHEKNVATDYRNEQAKIQAWQNEALHGHGWRKYKAKRQLALYDQTTQENIRLSDQITEYITNLSSKVGPLTADEDNFMRCNLIEGWARLKYYRQMWHNFLASEQVDSTEKDMKRLEKAITLWLQKIWRTTNDIEHNMNATNQLWTNITYAVIQNDLKASYDKSLIQFKRERRMLSMKYGFGTAIASIWVGLWMQYLTWTGVFGKSTIECPEAEITAVKDNFALWSAELTNGSNNIYSDTKSALSSVSQSGSHLNLEYWAWTDATHVIPWRLKLSELIWSWWKISTAEGNIDALVGTNWFTQAHANVFKDALHHLPTGSWTNGVLQNMRQVEWIEEWARALADSWKSSLISPSDIMISHNPALDVIWTTNHTLADRVFNGVVDVAWPCIEHEAPKRGRWFMWFPLFFNTFKDRKATKDTTDQNFWRWNNQQPNRPNNQQPNRPQVNPNRPNNP